MIALRPDEAPAHPGSVGRPAPGARLRLMAGPGLAATPGKHPRGIELQDALPRTALGKVQKAQLAASLQAQPHGPG